MLLVQYVSIELNVKIFPKNVFFHILPKNRLSHNNVRTRAQDYLTQDRLITYAD